MYINLMIKKTLQKKPSLYINLLVVLTLAFTVINLPFILNSFDEYIDNRYNKDLAINSMFQIKGVNEEFLEYLNDIPEIESTYTRDLISIKMLGEITSEKVSKISNTIAEILKQHNDPHIAVISLYDLYTGKGIDRSYFYSIILATEVFFLFTAIIAIYLSFKAFIINRKKDLSIILSVGGSHKHLINLMIVEFISIFVLSAIFAFILSNLGMYVIIKIFMGKFQIIYAEMVKVFSPSTMLYFFISFISSLTAFIIEIFNFNSVSPAELSFTGEDINNKFHRNNKILNSNNIKKSLAILYIKRDSRQYKRLFPLMTIVVFIVFFIPNYFNHGVKSLDNSRISDIWVQSEYANQAVSALYNESELKAIKEMSKYVNCIEAVEYRSSVNMNSLEYYLAADTEKYTPQWNYEIEGRELNILKFTVFSEETFLKYASKNNKIISEYKNKGSIFLSKNLKNSSYEIGDKITIVKVNYDGHEHDDEQENEQYLHHVEIELTIAGFIDKTPINNCVEIFISLENFIDITNGISQINSMAIRVKDEYMQKANEAEKQLSNYFETNNVPYYINNQIHKNTAVQERAEGITLLADIVCFLLVAILFLTMYMFIYGYLQSREKHICQFYILGASKKDIILPFLLQSIFYGLICAVISFSLSILTLNYVMDSMNEVIIADLTTIIIYIVVFCVSSTVFIYPTFISLKKIIKRIEENTSCLF